jgi:hypothetical protein
MMSLGCGIQTFVVVFEAVRGQGDLLAAGIVCGCTGVIASRSRRITLTPKIEGSWLRRWGKDKTRCKNAKYG